MHFFGLFWLVEGFQAYCILLWTAANLQFSRHDPLLSAIKVCDATFCTLDQLLREIVPEISENVPPAGFVTANNSVAANSEADK